MKTETPVTQYTRRVLWYQTVGRNSIPDGGRAFVMKEHVIRAERDPENWHGTLLHLDTGKTIQAGNELADIAIKMDEE